MGAVSQAVKIEVSAGTSVTVSNAITLTAGALAVALVSPFQGTGSNCAASDSINGAYGMRTAQDVGNSAVRFGDKAGITGGLANLTADGGALANGVVGIWHEVTGAATVPFDTQQGATGTSAAPDTVNVANAQADSIYFAAMATLDGGNPITYTINASGSEGTWVEKDATNSRELNGATFPACGVVYQIVSSILARSHTWTTINTGWAAASVIYKLAVGGVGWIDSNRPFPFKPGSGGALGRGF